MKSHQMLTLLQMQDDMNTKVNPDWRSQGNEWYRAIWIECGEMLDHFGWKWWKHQECDREQVVLELIDILHFGLSKLIEANTSLSKLANDLTKNWPSSFEMREFTNVLEEFTLHTLKTKDFDIYKFLELAYQIDVDSEMLFKGYIAKNVLNVFRQDYGYKEGTYIKIWDGLEDNEVLVRLCDRLDASSASFKEDVYLGLAKAYPKTEIS